MGNVFQQIVYLLFIYTLLISCPCYVAKGLTSLLLSVLCVLIFHLLLFSLHIHKLLVQGFWAKVHSLLIWTHMYTTLTIYTHPTTHRHSGTASRAPTPTGTLIIRRAMDSYTPQLGTTLTTESTTWLSHKLMIITSTQMCSSRILTSSSRLVLLSQLFTSALTHHQPSRTTLPQCPPFTSILTPSLLMAIRPSERAQFHLTVHPIIMPCKPKKM